MVAVVSARLLLAVGEPDAAVEALDGAAAPVILARACVERAVLHAIALDRLDEPERAARALEDATEPSWATCAIRSHSPIARAGR
jgi:hypothetical protein